jgi:hypothetical protein
MASIYTTNSQDGAIFGLKNPTLQSRKYAFNERAELWHNNLSGFQHLFVGSNIVTIDIDFI